MSVKTGIVILSRYNSSRLPGKALKEIGGKPALTLIIERLLQVVSSEQIILATSEEESDDPIAEFAALTNILCFRGSLDNVAERFYLAARSQNWEYATRINGDNIFLDTDVLRTMINIASCQKYDFITNVKDRTFPKGMSIEIVRLSYYQKAFTQISLSEMYREHVTLFFYEHPGSSFYYHYNVQFPEAAGIQLALDTPEDFDRTNAIYSQFIEPHWSYNLKEIFNIWKKLKYE